jgi:hypothetical protein
MTVLDSASGLISEADALEVAAAAEGSMGRKPADAWLVRATDSATLRSDSPVADRAVWVVHFSEVNEPVSIPITARSAGEMQSTVDDAYVYIDASTGEYLYTYLE